MMTKCRYYVDDKRNCTTKFNLDIVQKSWMQGGFILGEPLSFEANSGVWSNRTDHSLTVVTTEGHVCYWKVVPDEN
jgi:hypothetical protein